MRFIGITGGVGAGKTEILKYIGQHYKCEIYLADEIGHKVKEPGTEGYHALVALMGDGILAPDGQIDKPAMPSFILRLKNIWRIVWQRQRIRAMWNCFLWKRHF